LGFQEAPLLLRLVGIRELLCNNCNLEFRGFVLFGKRERAHLTNPETIENRRREPRLSAHIPVKVAVILDSEPGQQIQYSKVLQGHTAAVSKIGLAILLPAITSGEYSFADANKGLWVSLELPTGPVTMRVTTVGHQAVDRANPASRYLIGVQIRKIDKDGRDRFFRYIDALK
jgi:hypothetical protein